MSACQTNGRHDLCSAVTVKTIRGPTTYKPPLRIHKLTLSLLHTIKQQSLQIRKFRTINLHHVNKRINIVKLCIHQAFETYQLYISKIASLQIVIYTKNCLPSLPILRSSNSLHISSLFSYTRAVSKPLKYVVKTTSLLRQ